MKNNPHGGDIYSRNYSCDFSVNVNPVGAPVSVLEAVKASAEKLSQYPDTSCTELREALAGKLSVPESSIIFGNGAAELIFALVQAVHPGQALLAAPCFAEYEAALQAVGCGISYYPLHEENEFALKDDFIEWITEETDLIFLCNPNNPTGKVIPEQLLLKVAERAGQCGAVLAVDECFWQFVRKEERVTLIKEIERYSSLFLLHAFTKTYAMPGLRLGYGISSNQELLERMERQLQAWNVSLPAQMAGVAALQEEEYVERIAPMIAAERRYLQTELVRMGLTVIPSSANYLLFAGPEDLKERCAEKKLLIRDCRNYHGLCAGWFRVAVRLHEENEVLIRILREILG